MRRLAIAFAILAASAPAADAAVRSGGHPGYLAPPGNSAVSQYLEVVPTDAGAAPASNSAAGKPAVRVTPAQQRELGRYGTTGRALATVVDETSPSTSGRGQAESRPASTLSRHRRVLPTRRSSTPATATHHRAIPPKTSRHRSRPSGSGAAPVGAVLSAATGHEVGGGLGILLPLLAGGSLAVVAIVLARRRGMRRS